MKKSMRFFVSIMFVLMFTLPFALVACDTSSQNQQGYSQQQTTSPTTYTISLSANNSAYGSVYGSGTYAEDEYISIYAIAKDGYEFVSWNDGNTNAVRTINVSQNKSYTATFSEKTKYYTLDKVEIFLTAGTNFSAQTVGFIEFNITTNNHQNADTLYVCRQKGFATGIEMSSLPLLCSTNDGLEHGNILATTDSPYVFYAPRASANKFESGQTTQLHYNFSRTCWKFVTTSDNTYEYEQLHSVVNPSSSSNFNLSVTATTLTQTICICTDTDHDYCVYARLNFVEL